MWSRSWPTLGRIPIGFSLPEYSTARVDHTRTDPLHPSNPTAVRNNAFTRLAELLGPWALAVQLARLYAAYNCYTVVSYLFPLPRCRSWPGASNPSPNGYRVALFFPCTGNELISPFSTIRIHTNNMLAPRCQAPRLLLDCVGNILCARVPIYSASKPSDFFPIGPMCHLSCAPSPRPPQSSPQETLATSVRFDYYSAAAVTPCA